MKKYLEKGSITIEASVVFTIFIIAYLVINNIALGLIVESATRKALFETGQDLASLVQVIDSFQESNQMRTGQVEWSDYEKIIMENVISQDIINLDDLSQAFQKELAEDGPRFLKDKAFEGASKAIFLSKISDFNNSSNLIDLGIIKGGQGIKLEDLSILEASPELSLEVSYKYKLDRFGIFAFENKVHQKYLTNTWSVNYLNSLNNGFDSIWLKSNFERGRYFADQIRQEASHPIKKGSGLDLYDPDSNTIYQVFSINIFNKTYSSLEDGSYKIDEKFISQVKSYQRELVKNWKDSKGLINLKDGQQVKPKSPNLRLILIMPEESLEMTDLGNYSQILKELGDPLILYREKALDASDNNI